MKRILVLISLAIALFIFVGCSSGFSYGVELVYAPTIHWNDTDYTITPNTEVAAEDIGEQINTVKKIVKKVPKENCEANSFIKVGSKLYRIKDENIRESIAIKINDKYMKAVIMARWKNKTTN